MITVDNKLINQFRSEWQLHGSFPLPSDFIWFNKFLNTSYEGINLGKCYGNSLFILSYKHKKQKQVYKNLRLCVGVAVRIELVLAFLYNNLHVREMQILTPHAWNLTKTGKIIDFTWGDAKVRDTLYFGKIVSSSDVEKMKNVPCVRKHLWQLLGLKANQFWDDKLPMDYDLTEQWKNESA